MGVVAVKGPCGNGNLLALECISVHTLVVVML